MDGATSSTKPPFAAYLALIGICFFWGTLYLAIRIALEAFPPVLFMGGRFFLAGVAILAVGKAAGARMPSRREFALTSLYGVITLGLGIGTLAFAMQWIPSGLAAMLTTTSPFWMVGVEAFLPRTGGRIRNERPNRGTVAGMLVGLAGTLLLVAPGAIAQGMGGALVFSFLVLQLGCGGFALGSILERRHATTVHPVIISGVQELATGMVFLIPALSMNESVHWNWRSVAAVLYVFVFGGVLGYSAYLYAMKHLPVSLVSIYNYVNPVVAVIAGALLYGERFTILDFAAMAVIFAGVFLVKRFSGRDGDGDTATQAVVQTS
jgi:drug/metabolite transporter (DMT)-like permease